MNDSLTGGLLRLLRRRWYVALVVLIVGALVSGLLARSADVGGTQSVQVGSVEQASKALGLLESPDFDGQATVAQLNARYVNSAPAPDVAVTMRWDDAARLVTISYAAPSTRAVVAAADIVGADLTSALSMPVTNALTLAVDDLGEQIDATTATNDQLGTTIASLAVDDPTRAVLLSRQADLQLELAKLRNQRSSLGALNGLVPSLIVVPPPVVATASAGPSSVAAGAIVAGALLLIGAALWVLADRRIRRRRQVERAAPGLPVLGLLAPSRDGAVQLDAAVVAALQSFVDGSQLSSVVLFPAPRAAGSAEPVADALRAAVDFDVEATERPAAEAVRVPPVIGVGYVVLVLWGATTEAELSTSVADVRSAGPLAIAALLVDVPAGERSWAGATDVVDMGQGGAV